MAGGLDVDRDLRARIQYGSSLRNVGRLDDAVAVLDEAINRYPDSIAARCFRALALADTGNARAATADLLDIAIDQVDTAEMRGYSRA